MIPTHENPTFLQCSERRDFIIRKTSFLRVPTRRNVLRTIFSTQITSDVTCGDSKFIGFLKQRKLRQLFRKRDEPSEFGTVQKVISRKKVSKRVTFSEKVKFKYIDSDIVETEDLAVQDAHKSRPRIRSAPY